MSLHPLAMIEGDVCDVADMAVLTTNVMEDLMMVLQRLQQEGRNPLFPEHEVHMLSFCCNHLSTLSMKLKDSFYERFEEGQRKPS